MSIPLLGAGCTQPAAFVRSFVPRDSRVPAFIWQSGRGKERGGGGGGGSRKGLGGRKWRETIAAFVQWGWWRGPWGHAMGAIPQRIAQRAPGLWWP